MQVVTHPIEHSFHVLHLEDIDLPQPSSLAANSSRPSSDSHPIPLDTLRPLIPKRNQPHLPPLVVQLDHDWLLILLIVATQR